MKKYLKFNSIFAATLIGSSLLVALFNATIDAYGVVKSPVIQDVNELKPEKDSHVRLFKAVDITRIRPKTIFLGTSRTEIGLDPAHPAIASDDRPVYNAALPGSNMYETRRYFEHALSNQPNLKQVVIGLDFFMFNQFNRNKPGFSDSRLGAHQLTIRDALDTKFSLDAVDSSVRTIVGNLKNAEDSDYYPDGRREKLVSSRSSLPDKFRKSLITYLQEPTFGKRFKLSKKYMDDLRSIVQTCNQRGIKLVLFISPSHATQWEVIQATGDWAAFEQWKRELTQIAPVWDFSGYNSITTEPISNRMQYYVDSSHYHRQTGDRVLNRLLHFDEQRVPKDFGVLLTPHTVDAHLRKIRADRTAWVSRNSTEAQLVHQLKQQVQATRSDGSQPKRPETSES